MSKVDANVMTALEGPETSDVNDKKARVRVIIVCEKNCIGVAEEMKKQKVFVKQIIPELDMLISEISADDIAFFEEHNNVLAIELDEDVEIQDQGQDNDID